MRVGLIGAMALSAAACVLVPRLGDPTYLVNDSRFIACGIPADKAWMAFTMAEARDFSRHFPGWTEGADELQVTEPALVVLGNGTVRMGPEMTYDMCIVVGPPEGGIVHRYGPTRFDVVLPDLEGPIVQMP